MVLFSNASMLVAIKAVSMLSSFWVLPLYYVYFNEDKLLIGIWLTFFVALLVFQSLDFGVGNRLKNDILSLSVDSVSKSKRLITKCLVSYFILAILLTLLFFLFLIFYGYNEFLVFFGIDQDLGLLFIVVFSVYLLLNFPLKIIIPLLQSQQKNALSGFILVFPQMIIFLYILIVKEPISAFPIFELFLFLCVMQSLLNFGIALRYLRIDFKFFILIFSSFFKLLSCFRCSISSGFSFFIVQLSLVFLFSSNEIFYGIFNQPELVVDYQYYYRPFSLFFVGFSIITLPFWSAIRRFVVTNDYHKARAYATYLFLMSVSTLVVIVPFGFNFDFFLDFWLGSDFFNPRVEYVLIFCIFSFFMCFLMFLSAVLNSMDLILIQAKVLGASLLFKLSIVFSFKFFGFNIEDFDIVLYSTVVALVVSVLILSFYTNFQWDKYFKNFRRLA